jgi:hypothetical protein
VLEQRDLYAGFAAAARDGGPLPCAGCAQTATCYPESVDAPAAVVTRLTPLSFFDYGCFATERLQWTYEQFAAMLGGAPSTTAEPRLGGAAGGGFELRYGERRYLFEGDMHGKLPLEVLRLKLILFAQLAGAVSRLHRATRLPHLGLSPAVVVVRRGVSAPDIPQLYSFETRVAGVGECLPRRGLNAAVAEAVTVPLLEPPLARDSTYVGSLTSERVASHEGMLSVRAVTESGGIVRVEAELVCESIDPREFVARDLLVLSLSGRSVRLSIELAGHPLRASGQRVDLMTLPQRAGADTVSVLRQFIGQPGVRVAFTIYPCLHVPADVQTLGLILMATLAANAEQGAGAVASAARSASERVLRFVRESPAAPPEAIDGAARAELQRLDEQGVLARRQLFHSPSQVPDPKVAIADVFWYGALMLGLRALTQVPNFGFCRTRDDFDPEHPEGPVDRLRAELGLMTQKLDAELLGRRGMHQVFAAALKRAGQEAAQAAARS